jgi:hypothetical protein
MKFLGMLWATSVALLPAFLKRFVPDADSSAGVLSLRGGEQSAAPSIKMYEDKTMATLITEPINSFDEATVISSIDYFLQQGFKGNTPHTVTRRKIGFFFEVFVFVCKRACWSNPILCAAIGKLLFALYVVRPDSMVSALCGDVNSDPVPCPVP